ncbi:MAG: hypothetical protein FWG03_01550 [Clostridiales bacterium]|nr:hypothetical protein [Clostridiales bacterium]
MKKTTTKKAVLIIFAFCALLALAGCKGGAAADSSGGSGGGAADPPAGSAAGDPASGTAPQDDGSPSSDLSADDSGNAGNASPHGAPLPTPVGDVIEVKEKMFVAQMNDIYYNADDYLGKTIKYEGIFDIYEEDTGVDYYFVIRYGPGCCGIDLNAGLEVAWDKGYPEQNDWVEVVGVLEDYEDNGNNYLRLALSSLTVLDVRGAEVVTQ